MRACNDVFNIKPKKINFKKLKDWQASFDFTLSVFKEPLKRTNKHSKGARYNYLIKMIKTGQKTQTLDIAAQNLKSVT